MVIELFLVKQEVDLLEELGVNISSTPNEIDYLLEHVGIAFLFAPAMHPALRRIMKNKKRVKRADDL